MESCFQHALRQPLKKPQIRCIFYWFLNSQFTSSGSLKMCISDDWDWRKFFLENFYPMGCFWHFVHWQLVWFEVSSISFSIVQCILTINFILFMNVSHVRKFFAMNTRLRHRMRSSNVRDCISIFLILMDLQNSSWRTFGYDSSPDL